MINRRIPLLFLISLAVAPQARLLAPAAAAEPPAPDPGVPPAAAAPAAPPASDGPVYNIEIVIFRTTGTPTGEDFAAEPSMRGGSGTDVEAGSGGRAGRFVQSIPATQFQLNDVEAKLKAAAGYQPLAHIAWSQTASAFGMRAGFSLQKLGVTTPGLSGLIFLERGQFLHLGMALTYAPGDAPGYRLSEIRRIRFYEKNYYDHPAFGAIALVTPAQGSRAPGR
jgi:hypothetical protein